MSYDISTWGNINAVTTGFDRTMIINPAFKFFIDNSGIEWRDFGNYQALIRAYVECTPLSSIIANKAKSFAGGKMEVLNANTLNYVRGAYKEWEQLLNNPNPIQSRQGFFKQIYTYLQLQGYCILLKIYPSGFRDRPSKLFCLPFWCIDIEDRNKPLHDIQQDDLYRDIYFCYGGKRTLLNPKDIIIIRDDTGIYNERTWMPKGKVELLRNPITTFLSCDEAEITLIQKKGALGILSNKTSDKSGYVPIGEEEKQELQNDFQRYGLSRSQWQYIITSANLEWQPMTFPASELQLQESSVKAVKAMCDKLGYYYELTAYSERKNLSNVNSFDRMQYQNFVIPEAEDIMEQITQGLVGDLPILMRMDYSNAPALQQSDEAKGKGLQALNQALQIEWDNGLITRNDWLEAIGKDKVSNPEFDKYKFEVQAEMEENNQQAQQNTE
jgi:hypothetical protein